MADRQNNDGKMEGKSFGRLSEEAYESLKNEQLHLLSELRDDACKLIRWTEEFRTLLESNRPQEEVFAWSMENNIAKELKHLCIADDEK